jgi:hypothetical protein
MGNHNAHHRRRRRGRHHRHSIRRAVSFLILGGPSLMAAGAWLVLADGGELRVAGAFAFAIGTYLSVGTYLTLWGH